jgi:gliding motility-associated-like protein
MFRACFIPVLLLAICCSLTAQPQAAQWHFGMGCAVSFSSGTPVALDTSSIFTTEGSAAICDHTGKLLLYTDGITIWNGQQQEMPNGTGLHGDPSSSQSGVIVPYPGDSSRYVVLSVDLEAGMRGLTYSVVDMRQDNGLGAVTLKNIQLESQVTEKITAVQHANGRDFWIIAHDWGNDHFLAYRLTPAGIDPVPVISKTGTVHIGNNLNTIGCMKASADGTMLALAIWGGLGTPDALNTVDILRFNAATGLVSAPVSIRYPKHQSSAYGVEFSPDSRKLYVSISNGGSILQYDLSRYEAASIRGSGIRVYHNISTLAGALQLGPDQKIYIAFPATKRLGVINDPNQPGMACGVEANGVVFTQSYQWVQYGLPNYVPSFFFKYTLSLTDTCQYARIPLRLSSYQYVDSLRWTTGDTLFDSSSQATATAPLLLLRDTGYHTITATLYRSGLPYTASARFYVRPGILLTPVSDTVICGQPLRIRYSDSLAQYLWSDGTGRNERMITRQGTYAVTASNTYGCTAADTFSVEQCLCELYIPSAFTPNNDGINDRFIPGSCSVDHFEMHIYNRWGQEIFYTTDITEGWDGRSESRLCQPDTYVYMASFTLRYGSGKEISRQVSGSVTLLR